MDSATSTARIPGPVQQTTNLQPLITIVVLTAGVVGGLVLVISVILFCKYCFKKKKVLKRQPAVFSKNSPERTFIQLPKFDSVDSLSESQVLFTEHDQASHEQLRDGHGLADDEDDNIDIAVARYQESLKAENQSQISQISDVSSQRDRESRRDSSQYTSSSRRDSRNTVVCVDDDRSSQGRRVSFHLTNDVMPSRLRKGRSIYTDGDYHHLKKLKIEKGPGSAQIIRQSSVGVPIALYKDRVISERERYTRSMTDDPSMFQDSYFDVHLDPTTPMLPTDNIEIPSPVIMSTKTEVTADVHFTSNSNSSLGSIGSKTSRVSRSSKGNTKKETVFLAETHFPKISCLPDSKHSVSMEFMTPVQHGDCKSQTSQRNRRVKSYEGDLHDYEYENQFNKGPFYNADYDVVSEGGGSPGLKRSKVSYNDTGSKEDINSDTAIEMLDEIVVEAMSLTGSDDTETLNGAQKYKELWNLRATFEEEEDVSDTVHMDGATPPEHSPDREIATTSFESNTEPVYQEESDIVLSDHHSPSDCSKSSNLLHPNYEARRQTYKSILSKRLKKIDVKNSADNSFDSVETMDTDGEVSDTSRPVDTTTSFESTTDNTDSTGDSQTHKLQQMKADSGYKSLETEKRPKLTKKQIHFALETDSYEQEEEEYDIQSSIDKSPEAAIAPPITSSPSKRSRSGKPSSHFDRRNGKTASKKRREYRAERQIIHVYENMNTLETDSKSEPPSGDSFDENSTPSKFSVFSRFFKSQSRDAKQRSLQRDFSIDSKSDALFNEFSRNDPDNLQSPIETRSPRSYARPRLQRKHTEPGEINRFRRDKLAPEMRSTSLGSDSSVASSRRLSPQDSIEEEYVKSEALRTWEILRSSVDSSGSAGQPATIHEIPIIRLPDEEVSSEVGIKNV